MSYYPPPRPGVSSPYAPVGNPFASSLDNQVGFRPDAKNPYEGERFQPKKRINDPIFLILFVLQFIGFAVLAVVTIPTWVKTAGRASPGNNTNNTFGNNTIDLVQFNSATIILLLLITAVSLVLSCIYLVITRMFTKAIMHITLCLSIALTVAIAAYFWIKLIYIAAIVATVIALFSVLAYWGYRARIPLASLLLQVVIDVSNHHKIVYVIGFISLILQAAFSALFVVVCIATYSTYGIHTDACDANQAAGKPLSSCINGKTIGIIAFALFSFIWTSQVIGNVALSTLAGGPYGSWYYFGPREQGNMPKNPTLSAFGRASTLSLGSIAFGSLIVTILEFIRLILRSIADQNGGDGVMQILACCAACFIGCLENLVEYFNRYAYIEIALYGKPYIAAAKDTWRLFRDRGITVIVNDSLVNMVLTWGAYAIGLLSVLFAYIYMRVNPQYGDQGSEFTAAVLLFSFIVGLQSSITLTSCLEAGVSTIFVGLGEDPQVLAIRAPELFQLIAMTYPAVVQAVA